MAKSIKIPVIAAIIASLLAEAAAAADPLPAEKMAPFLMKNRPCYAWAFARYSIAPGLTSGDVFCVFDGVENEGTVSELSGCMVARYSAATNTYGDDSLLPTWEAPCSPKFVTLLFTDRRFQKQAIWFLGSIVGSDFIELGGAGGYALGRVLCDQVVGVNGLDCASFSEEAEAAAKKGTKPAPAKASKASKKAEEEEKAPEPPWLKKK